MKATCRFLTWVSLAACWGAFTSSGVLADDAQSQDRPHAIKRVREWSDTQLNRRIEEFFSKETVDDEFFHNNLEYEPCLLEVIRRAKPDSVAFVKKQLDRLMVARFRYGPDEEDFDAGAELNLELLTALRRLRKQPDPLEVLVKVPRGPLKVTTLTLPSLDVGVRNVDIEKVTVGFQDGGDYRSGRQARWRVNVTSAEGKLVPRRSRYGVLYGGGVSSRKALEPGEVWETTLDVRQFIETPLPGRYTVEVLYHDIHAIADERDLAGLIVSRSTPLDMTVERFVIELGRVEQRLAADLIAQLPADAPLKIVAGSYGPWAHRFIEPNSTAGKLLSMGMKGAPALVEALDSDDLPASRRAWILAILFSASGESDPRRSGGLANYAYIEGPWQIWGGAANGPKSGGIGFASEGSSKGGTLDEKKLIEFSRQWRAWLPAYCTVRISDGK